MSKENYRPLPECVTIKESTIEGLGLFATEDIEKDSFLGTSHYITQEGNLIRTPLGGFYNHSEDPNVYSKLVNNNLKEHGMIFSELRASRDIKAGEELTAHYKLNPLKEPQTKKKSNDIYELNVLFFREASEAQFNQMDAIDAATEEDND